MIVFDLDGCLADCEHRRCLVEDPIDSCHFCYTKLKYGACDIDYQCQECKRYPAKWKRDWQAFYEACDQDKPIFPSIYLCRHLSNSKNKVQIWSGRCESLRKKTEMWLDNHNVYHDVLKMRPIGDSTPDDELKERWLDEYINSAWPPLNPSINESQVYKRKDPIHFIFDSVPKSIAMWRRRGIFVFECNQSGKEF